MRSRASAPRRAAAWGSLALAAVVLPLGACSSPGPGTAAPPAAAASAAPVIRTAAVPVPHRQWLNLAYATRSSAEKLDLYMPAHLPARSGPPGLVVYVHGGASPAGQGDKADAWSLKFVNAFLSIGYAAASINYRLSDEAHSPAQIQDVKAAIQWLRGHAAKYGYAPGKIAAVGDSPGQLVALVGTPEGAPSLRLLRETIGPGEGMSRRSFPPPRGGPRAPRLPEYPESPGKPESLPEGNA